MENGKTGYVFAMSKVSKKVSIRTFVDTGKEVDCEEALDSACEEVGWNAVWAVHSGELSGDVINGVISRLTKYASYPIEESEQY